MFDLERFNPLNNNHFCEFCQYALIIIDADSKEIVKVNQVALKLFEYEDDKGLVGHNLKSLGIRQIYEASKEINNQKNTKRYKFISDYTLADGDVLYLEVNLQQVSSSNNSYIIYRISEISEQCQYCYQKMQQKYFEDQYQSIHEVNKLSTIFASMRDLEDFDKFSEQLLKTLLLRIDSTHGFIFLNNIFDDNSYIKKEFNYKLEGKSFRLIKRLIKSQGYFNREELDEILDKEFSETPFNFFVEVLRAEGKILGIIVVMDMKKDYSKFVKEVIQAFSIYLKGGITKIKILKEEIEKNKLDKEIEIASKIQNSFIPKQTPQLEDLELAIYYNPAKEVGGDYFAFKQTNDKLNLFISDVMGKGIPAAIIVATVHSALNILSRLDKSPSEVLKNINNNLYHDLKNSPTFVSAFYGSFDFVDKSFIYSNAAHNQPILWSKKEKKIINLAERGILCGVKEDYSYAKHRLKLNHGDILLIYTDGLIDIQNKLGERFTLNRLNQILIENNQLSAEDIKEKLVEEIYSFSEGIPFPDDISLIICKFLGGESNEKYR
ncbi:PP2C family protein-serine/threonine phosphatase [Orenia marismortui]|uniref:PP2C family protein-serine/threonine phosphatase n=1 Tax=Orenia marismortui TaxID=46469 RepID=UPI000380DCE8|nr:PP2C family protein-serine/threonine phosphatase [Orenia marismortui]